MPRARLHDLRRTHASLLLLQGIHAKVAQESSGHANIGIVVDIIRASYGDAGGDSGGLDETPSKTLHFQNVGKRLGARGGKPLRCGRNVGR